MWNDRTKNYSRRKKYFKIKNSYTRFCCLYVKVATIQANFRANEQNPVDLQLSNGDSEAHSQRQRKFDNSYTLKFFVQFDSHAAI